MLWRRVIDILHAEPPDHELRGAYFCITPIVNDAGEDVIDLKFTGSAETHPLDGFADITYRPSNGFLKSEVMAEIYNTKSR